MRAIEEDPEPTYKFKRGERVRAQSIFNRIEERCGEIHPYEWEEGSISINLSEEDINLIKRITWLDPTEGE